MPAGTKNSVLGLWGILFPFAALSFAGGPALRVTADEFVFKPARIEVPEGAVTITVTNQGAFPHGLAIVGVEEKITFIDSGETKTLTVNFEQPGERVFYCPQPGHRQKGMEGKLRVKSR